MTSTFEALRKNAKAALIARQPSVYWWYRKLLRGWAEEEMSLLPAFCLPGSLAIDVGANHGLFTHYLSGLCGHVHAFEPSPRMAAILRQGYRRRGNVTVHEVALSNAEGTAILQVPTFVGFSGYATLERADLTHKVELDRPPEQISVVTRRLDSFALRNVSFLKVDVEGHEQEVLEGARETLQRESLIVLVELEERHRPHAVRDVSALLTGLGYQGYFLRDQKLVSLAQFRPERDQDARHPHGQAYVRNFVFAAPVRVRDLSSRLANLGYTIEHA
jgi:FkbM family methyltransferase